MKNKCLKTVLAVAMAGAVLFTGCGINKNATLVNIDKGKDTISMGYGNFYARFTQSMYDGMYSGYIGDEMWSQKQGDQTMEELVKENILTSMEEGYVLQKHAEEYDVKLSDKEKKAITKAAKKFIKNNKKETLKEMGATQEYVEQYLTEQTIVKKMEAAIKAKAKVSVSDEDAAQRAISYVKFSTADSTDQSGETVEVTKEQKKEMKSQAKALAASENFDEDAKAAGVEVKTTTYGKDDSSLDEAVTKAADALEVGQVSDVIAVKNVGYYVVRLDSQYDEKATAKKKASLEEEQRSKTYNKQVESWKKKITWKVDKKQWAKVKFDTMFEAKSTEGNK